MDAWLTAARNRLLQETNGPAEGLDLSAEDEATILELARIAAHESGARTNAPLLCYLLGRAQGDRPLDELATAVTRSSS